LHGLQNQTLDSEGIDPISPSTLVLFPGKGAHLLTREHAATLARPLTLLVPDGSWSQAKKMMRRIPMLCQAHPVSLGASRLNSKCLRRNAHADRMSTFEAIAQALGILESHETEMHLLEFFHKVLDRMVKVFPSMS
jgi:DTW domain-containing protein